MVAIDYSRNNAALQTLGSMRERTRRMQTTQAPPRAGDTLPEIVLPRLDGGDLNLGDLRGKRLLLYMWGSW